MKTHCSRAVHALAKALKERGLTMNRSDSPTDRADSADSAVRVDHLGRDMAAALLSRSEKLEPTIEARLATARQAALAAARDARSAQFAPEMALQSTTAGGGRTPRQRAWLGWLLPASVLIAGLLLLAHSQRGPGNAGAGRPRCARAARRPAAQRLWRPGLQRSTWTRSPRKRRRRPTRKRPSLEPCRALAEPVAELGPEPGLLALLLAVTAASSQTAAPVWAGKTGRVERHAARHPGAPGRAVGETALLRATPGR